MNMTALINNKLARQFLILAIAALIASSALAQELGDASIDGFSLLMGLFGGLALFLFGIEQMSQGLKAVAGDGMATLLFSTAQGATVRPVPSKTSAPGKN